MPAVALVLFIIAGVIFIAATFNADHPKVRFVPLGLVFLTAALICQTLIHSNIVH
jgi:hypothetical protein